jgi:hypothetical protein
MSFPRHILFLLDNAKEVEALTSIHTKVAGRKRGRKSGVEVLNKSAIVLLVACWEKYVEELASTAFSSMLRRANEPVAFPARVRTLASKDLKVDKDETKVWQLAGNGWKTVLEKHKAKTLQRFLGAFNTPKTENINKLYYELFGIKRISKDWSWTRMSSAKAERRLDKLIRLRGQIVHQVKTTRSVQKNTVRNYTHFVKRLAALISNSVCQHILDHTGRQPWDLVRYTAA